MNKKQAGSLGGKSTVRKYGNEYMRKIGILGAKATWTKYTLKPVGQTEYAMVERTTNKIIAIW